MDAGPGFEDRLRKAETAELERRYAQSAELARSSQLAARNLKESAAANSVLARIMAKSGSPNEALRLYLEVLKEPSDVVNENGLPYAYLAANNLVKLTTASDRDVLDRIAPDLEPESLPIMRPDPARTLRVVLDALKKSGNITMQQTLKTASDRLSSHITYLDQCEALQEALALHKLTLDEKNWKSFGGDWLVGITTVSEEIKPRVVALSRDAIFNDVKINRTKDNPLKNFYIAPGGDGEQLGSSFPDLRITFDADEVARLEASSTRSGWIYGAALALFVCLTLSGGYLLWRDTHREVRIAEMRSQFVSSVSHELKTPLTAIRMFAETLQMRAGADPKIQAEYLETIVNETERLTRLLNNVLDFSRIERGQKNYHMESAPLADVVHSAARTMRFPLTEQGFNFRVDVCDGLPPIRLDRDAIEQAILNLLSNAMKYSGQSKDIDLRLCTQNGSVMIQVEDRGIGIPADERERIFERFYRVPTAENRAISGTGLGLALVVHIAEAHGGRVEVESTPGAGSTFSVRLPLPAGECGMEGRVTA
jgi:signal transduction histidine kinase